MPCQAPIFKAMDLYISWRTTFDAEDPKFDVLADDSEALRRKNQAMDAGKRIIESWLLRVGGQPINFDGADGHCQVPANELTDLERIRIQYAHTLGTGVRVAMGVGIKLSESDQALKACMKQGGDRIVLFTPEEAGEEVAESPALNKAEPAKNPAVAGGGITGATRPSAAAAPQKGGEASEHSQAESELSALDNAPPAPELTHSGADAEAAFQDHADKADEDEKSQAEESGKADADSELKKEVIKVLQQVKAQAPALAQLTATEPKLFAAIQESIHAMLMLAKRVVGGQPMAKALRKDLTVLVIPQESQPIPVPAPEPDWAYHIVSEWDNLGDIITSGLKPRAEEGTAVLHFTTDFDSIKDLEGDVLRFPVPLDSAPNPYRPDKPSERITTLTIPPASLQLCSQWRSLDAKKSEPVWKYLDGPTRSHIAEYLKLADRDPVLKSDRYFHQSAFLGKNGKVITTGSWHDIEQLPEGFEIAEEGFVSIDGKFYDRKTATEMSEPVKKSDEKIEEAFEEKPKDTTKLDKAEFRSKDGIVIPSKDSPARRAYDKAHVQRVSQQFGHNMDIKPRMVALSDLATASSGNMAVNKSRYNLYRRMLAAGDRLPPIVIRKNGLKYDIIDGSHRVQATLDHNGNNVNVPPKVPVLHALEMTPKKLPLKKALPTEQESKANQEHHLVLQDLAQEKGKVMPHTHAKLARVHDKITELKPQAHNRIEEVRGLNSDIAHTQGEDDAPSMPALVYDRHGGWNSPKGSMYNINALANDRAFWRALNEGAAPSIMKKLPLPENAPTHTQHQYPVGAVKDHSAQGTRDVGKVKVRHDNGKTGWVSVRAGQVLSQDGHPISSRNPGGK